MQTQGQQTKGSGICALIQVRCLVQVSVCIRSKSFPLRNPFLLCASALIQSYIQLGTWKTHLGSRLLLLTQGVNNRLMHCREVLPVLCCSSTADVVCLTLTTVVTQAPVCVEALYMHESSSTTTSTCSCCSRCFIYILLAQLPRTGKSQRKQYCCCLLTGCFLS